MLPKIQITILKQKGADFRMSLQSLFYKKHKLFYQFGIQKYIVEHAEITFI